MGLYAGSNGSLSPATADANANGMVSSGVMEWNEDRVAEFFTGVGLPKYDEAIKEHGITGDVLVRLDHDLLKDIGVTSLGKRLKILKAVYQMKVVEEIPMEEGDWHPPSAMDSDDVRALYTATSHSSLSAHSTFTSSSTSPPLTAHSAYMPLSHSSADSSSGSGVHVDMLLQERDNRISSLEGELRHLQEDLSNMTRYLAGAATALPSPSTATATAVVSGMTRKSSLSRNAVKSPTTPLHPLSNDATAFFTHGRSGSQHWRSNHLDSPRTPASAGSSPHLPSPAMLGAGLPDLQTSTPSAPAFSFAVSNGNDPSGSKGLKNQLSTASLRSVGSNATVTPNGPTNGLPEDPVSPRSMTSSSTPRPSSPASSQPPTLPRPIAVPSLSQAISPALLSLPPEAAPAIAQDLSVVSPVMPSLPSPAPTPTSSAPPPLSSDLDPAPIASTSQAAPKSSPSTDRTAPAPSVKSKSSSRTAGSSSSGKTSTAGGAGDRSSPFPKSFRVTIEDPCWKVLPAVLKKYKLDDDPKKYVLFLCYGSEERCLGYEEKPLMLFQKLRAADKNPVFTLRHIKDLPNPVLAANTKHKQRLLRHPPPNGERFTADGPQNDNSAAKALTPGYSRNTRLHQPPTLLATTADKEREAAAAAAKANGEEGSDRPATGGKEKERDPGAMQPQKEKLDPRAQRNPKEADGFAVAIYPYLADGPEEFDVTVGDTFVIMGKSKGWWVCHRDHGETAAASITTLKSGWVPSGCLLETSASFTKHDGATAVGTPIPPELIVSQSTASTVLMDYAAQTGDEASLRKGETVRVYKKYTHWSFVVNPTNHTRGWAPSWLLQKPSSDNSSSGHSSSRIKRPASKDKLKEAGDASAAATRDLPPTPTSASTITPSGGGSATPTAPEGVAAADGAAKAIEV